MQRNFLHKYKSFSELEVFSMGFYYIHMDIENMWTKFIDKCETFNQVPKQEKGQNKQEVYEV